MCANKRDPFSTVDRDHEADLSERRRQAFDFLEDPSAVDREPPSDPEAAVRSFRLTKAHDQLMVHLMFLSHISHRIRVGCSPTPLVTPQLLVVFQRGSLTWVCL